MKKRFVGQNLLPVISFHCQNPSEKIYISIICNVRMMLERIAVVSLLFRQMDPVLYQAGRQDSL